jgi:hypothetical protein
VRLEGAWSQSSGPARSECEIELVEVA